MSTDFIVKTARTTLYVAAVIGAFVLIAVMVVGIVVMVNPKTCNKWADYKNNTWPSKMYTSACTACTNCGENTEGGTECETCGACSEESFRVNNIRDIERIHWNQESNTEPTANWPGHEGYYNAPFGPPGSDDLNANGDDIRDNVLKSVIGDDVRQNHRNFIENTLTAQPIPGASHMGVKDNYNPVNKWWGLKRDSLHKQLGALGDARQVQSETRSQVADLAYRGNSYLL